MKHPVPSPALNSYERPYLSNLSTPLCRLTPPRLIAILILTLFVSSFGSESQAAGFHPSSCRASFSGGVAETAIVKTYSGLVTDTKTATVPLVSSLANPDQDYYSFAHELSEANITPVESYVRARVKALSGRLTHFERLQIFNRVLAGRRGLLSEFGRCLASASVKKSSFYFGQNGYISPTTSTLEHPVFGRLGHAGAGDYGIWFHADKVTREKQSMLKKHDALKTLTGDERSQARISFQNSRWTLLQDTFDFATGAFEMWKAASLVERSNESSMPPIKGEPRSTFASFSFVVDSSKGNLRADQYSGPPVAWYQGGIPSFKTTVNESQQQRDFAAWVNESQDRQDYAELLMALGFDRLAFVVSGPNGGRYLNDGKKVNPWWKAPGLIEKTKSRLGAVGSYEKARAALEDGFTGLRETADALPYQLDRSLIYDTQHQYHLAEDSSVLHLTLLDPVFSVFSERVDEQMKTASLFEQSVLDQIRRVDTLRAKMIESLEGGKIPWDLEENIALAESDFTKTEELVPLIKERLEAFHAFALKTMKDQAFVEPENRARFTEFEKSFGPKVQANDSKAQKLVQRLRREVLRLRAVLEKSESSRSESPALRELARQLWK